MNIRTTLFLALQLSIMTTGISQIVVDKSIDTTGRAEYQKRIKMTKIGGKYIPKDLQDAMSELDKLIEPGAKARFSSMNEAQARTETHFTFGRWFSVRWSMEDGSRLTEWFRMNKVFNTDYMIDCIITSYHRKLNNKPPEFENLVQYYYNKQKQTAKALEDKQIKARKTKAIPKPVK